MWNWFRHRRGNLFIHAFCVWECMIYDEHTGGTGLAFGSLCSLWYRGEKKIEMLHANLCRFCRNKFTFAIWWSDKLGSGTKFLICDANSTWCVWSQVHWDRIKTTPVIYFLFSMFGITTKFMIIFMEQSILCIHFKLLMGTIRSPNFSSNFYAFVLIKIILALNLNGRIYIWLLARECKSRGMLFVNLQCKK